MFAQRVMVCAGRDSLRSAIDMSEGVPSVRKVTELPPFESSLPEARRAAAGLSVGDVRAGVAVTDDGVEAQLVAALEESFVEYLLDADVGLELQQMLLSFPPRLLGASAQLEWLRAHARCSAWWAAQEAAALVAFAGMEPQQQTFEVRGEQVVVEDVAREEVAVVLRWTSSYAQGRIDEARLLVGSLPGTLQALGTGAISPAHVRVIAESASKLALTTPIGSARFTAACEQLERRVLPVAAHQGLSRTRSAANRAVSHIDPEGRIERRESAYRGRGVWLRDDSDGVSTIIGRMATEHAHAAMAAIEALARTEGWGDAALGVGERRSLAMLHLVLGGTAALNGDCSGDAGAAAPDHAERDAQTHAHSGSATCGEAHVARQTAQSSAGPQAATRTPLPPIRAHVDVVVDLPTLLGLQNNDAEIVGGGVISAESVRELVLADTSSTMRRLVTDPITGHLLDIGRRRYVIPESLREFIEIRDQRCRFPGCNARAVAAEIDHAVPWDAGGQSDRSNLGALCKRHHQVKTHGGWTITSSDDTGACRWRAPSGSTYAHDAVSLDARIADAAPVGASVGTSVGTSVGASAGPSIGASAGASVGSSVGTSVGTSASTALAASAEPGVPLADGDVGQAGNLIDDDS